MTTTERAELRTRQQIKNLAKENDAYAISIGITLREIKAQKLYLAENCKSINEWILTADLGISATYAKRLLKIAEKAEQYGVSDEVLKRVGAGAAYIALNAPATEVDTMLDLAQSGTNLRALKMISRKLDLLDFFIMLYDEVNRPKYDQERAAAAQRAEAGLQN